MAEKIVYQRPRSWIEGVHSHYCPGCTHGIIHRMIMRALDELDITEYNYRRRALWDALRSCTVT